MRSKRQYQIAKEKNKIKKQKPAVVTTWNFKETCIWSHYICGKQQTIIYVGRDNKLAKDHSLQDWLHHVISISNRHIFYANLHKNAHKKNEAYYT